MLALRVKERTGRGESIDVSMLEGQLSLLDQMVGAFLADGEKHPEPMGTAYKASCRTRPSAPGPATSPGRGQRASCGRPSVRPSAVRSWWATRAIAPTPTGRATATASIAELQEEFFLTRSYEEWETLLLAKGIPMGAINSIARGGGRAPPGAGRGTPVHMDHPRAGKVRMVGAPSGSPRRRAVRRRAPMLGEHTDQVLGQLLGLGVEQIAALRTAGVIGANR